MTRENCSISVPQPGNSCLRVECMFAEQRGRWCPRSEAGGVRTEQTAGVNNVLNQKQTHISSSQFLQVNYALLGYVCVSFCMFSLCCGQFVHFRDSLYSLSVFSLDCCHPEQSIAWKARLRFDLIGL